MIVSQELDPTADEVVLALGERGVPVFRIDRAWFPQRLTLEAELRGTRWAGCLQSAQRRVELENIHSVWHRWRSTFALSPQLSRPDRHTRLITDEDLTDLDQVALTAHQVQHYVDKTMDVRVVIVGDRIFPVAIHPLSQAARIDFRTDYRALRHEVIELPDAVEQGIRRFMTESGLLLASMDFSVDRDGRYYFLESNPAGGQYGWLEAKTGVPLTEAVADLLAQGGSGSL
ncbi:MAG TPA: hypothetical protein VK784_13275 [Pseudonocardiaceae bacterium]|nr:hypothetical protein [Pseudonocardiaceae bacterium]